MRPSRVPSLIVLSVLPPLLLGIAGCGGDEGLFPEESASTRAIREKVRADMDRDRLEQIGRRLAPIQNALVESGNAFLADPAALSSGDAGADSGEVNLARGKALYTKNCASCHGEVGNGDGPLSAGLVPQPAKHSDGGYMNALSNEHLTKVIKEGGAAVGKSAMMAPWGPSMSDAEIRDVVAYVRTLASPAYDGPGL